MTSQNQTRQLVVAVWCGLHCSEEHETSWKHPELVLPPDLGWESKDFLEAAAFQLRPEACLEWQNKEHSDRGMCTETGGENGAWP